MDTEPGGDAMTSDFNRDAELAALKRETVPRPQAWRIRQAEVARLVSRGEHCETRRCAAPAVIVTRRWWRAADVGRVLLAEHLTCERHGTEFAARHRIGVDPAGEVTARRLSHVEMLAFWVEHRHCDWPACKIAATWIFIETFTVRGAARSDQDLSCDRHARAFADRFHITITPEPGEGGAR
jgi:hypothetical protein